jgi:hypothetical protein
MREMVISRGKVAEVRARARTSRGKVGEVRARARTSRGKVREVHARARTSRGKVAEVRARARTSRGKVAGGGEQAVEVRVKAAVAARSPPAAGELRSRLHDGCAGTKRWEIWDARHRRALFEQGGGGLPRRNAAAEPCPASRERARAREPRRRRVSPALNGFLRIRRSDTATSCGIWIPVADHTGISAPRETLQRMWPPPANLPGTPVDRARTPVHRDGAQRGNSVTKDIHEHWDSRIHLSWPPAANSLGAAISYIVAV